MQEQSKAPSFSATRRILPSFVTTMMIIHIFLFLFQRGATHVADGFVIFSSGQHPFNTFSIGRGASMETARCCVQTSRKRRLTSTKASTLHRKTIHLLREGPVDLENSGESISETPLDDKTQYDKQSYIRDNVSNFSYGVDFVNSQYLFILWKYSIVRSITFTLPFGLLLWGTRFYAAPHLAQNMYALLYYPLYSLWAGSSIVARILQMPLEVSRWILSMFPALLLTSVEYLPNVLAVPMVQAVLAVRDILMWIAVAFTSNQLTSLLSSAVAILVWRPAVEEWEYRSILNKLLFAPNEIRSRVRKIPVSSTVSMVEYIPVEGGNVTSNQGIASDGILSTTPDKSHIKRRVVLPAANESNRILLGSILFATTRLGWLAWDPTSGDYSSPYSWTIGFLQSIMAHFSSQVLPEVRPSLKIWILLLAIHQTVSTFLVAQNVLAKVYRERGLVAAIGAHMTWTISKGTIPFRIIWRLWKWCRNMEGTLPPRNVKAKESSHLNVAR
ncbi:hypothetical protein IV203_016706 [Nitzschia inconspicua]|uniref:Uncharacterized protein n=1 Tax=Nitzschia inconspicua TaxID=303405 RepID=A0A9K3KR12_9STRA|nr:hypothetical protein IV203_016706 [Nitzschia inconspicua]